MRTYYEYPQGYFPRIIGCHFELDNIELRANLGSSNIPPSITAGALLLSTERTLGALNRVSR